MPYLLTDEQQQIAAEARRLLVQSYSGERLKGLLETPGAFDETFWIACRDMGWTGVTVPEAYGGLGLSAVELCLIALECGRVCAGAPFLATSFGVSEAIRLWGDEAVKQSNLPALAGGELKGVLAFGETPGEVAPADPAVRLQDGRLYGSKAWVVGAAAADIALVLAREEGCESRLVVADLNAGGVDRTLRDTLDNSRCVADLAFDGARATPLQASDAHAAARSVLQRVATVLAFEQLGGAETCMELARDYALQRYAFGQPIGRFQAIKHKIAEMYVANELARGNALRAAQAIAEEASDLPLRAAAARLSASAAYDYAAAEAIQVHGALGVTWEHDLHLHYRRSRATALELGARAAWEDVIVDALAEAA